MKSGNESYDDFIKRISQNIRRERLKRGFTQEDMTKFGFNYRHYQRVESGKNGLNLLTLFRLAEHFKINISVFFE